MILSDLIKQSAEKLKLSGADSPLLDAQVLAASALGIGRSQLLTRPDIELDPAEVKKIRRSVSRRGKGEPVAYITGRKEFYSLDFEVNRNVLIPRPETELLVDLSIYYAPLNGSVLDIGTGSGAIAVALKHNRPDLQVSASDISKKAVTVAGRNAGSILGPGKIKFMHGDLFAPMNGLIFDLIVSNPPYIDPGKKDLLQRELSLEPEIALFSGSAGAAHIERIISEAPGYLSDEGALILEIDPSLKAAVDRSGIDSGFSVSIMNDYSSLARVAILKRGGT